MLKKAIAYLVVGFLAALLWTAVESSLIPRLPLASSHLMWRATQVFVGLASALILVLPLALLLRPRSLWDGSLFIAGFLVSEIPLHLTFGGTAETLIGMSALPDIWVFLFSSLGFFWWASTRKLAAHAA
jgi:hypothetical protein